MTVTEVMQIAGPFILSVVAGLVGRVAKAIERNNVSVEVLKTTSAKNSKDLDELFSRIRALESQRRGE